MTQILITKNAQGKLSGFTDKDQRGFRRFMKHLEDLCFGDFMLFDFWVPRDQRTHRRHFKMLHAFFDQQERFDDIHQLRMWLQVGAGHCEWVPGPDGKMVAIPRSINFKTLDEHEFREHHEQVKGFMRSVHCQAFVWPYLSPHRRIDAMEELIELFERDSR